MTAWVDDLLQDLRIGCRTAARQPALFCAVTFTIVLTIAASASLFAIFDGVLFKPLPYLDPDQLVAIDGVLDLPSAEAGSVSGQLQTTPLFSDWASEHSSLLIEDGAEDGDGPFGLHPAAVTPNLFGLLGVKPFAGRLLSDDDYEVWASSPVMLGYALWQGRFRGDPAIIGRVMTLPGAQANRQMEVVGILPPDFAFPAGANVWGCLSRANPLYPRYARLAHDVTIAQVRAAFPASIRFTPDRRQLLLPVVLPQLRMLPDCLIGFVPAACEEWLRSTGPGYQGEDVGIASSRGRARRGPAGGRVAPERGVASPSPRKTTDEDATGTTIVASDDLWVPPICDARRSPPLRDRCIVTLMTPPPVSPFLSGVLQTRAVEPRVGAIPLLSAGASVLGPR